MSDIVVFWTVVKIVSDAAVIPIKPHCLTRPSAENIHTGFVLGSSAILESKILRVRKDRSMMSGCSESTRRV